jgi:hypothetical protein
VLEIKCPFTLADKSVKDGWKNFDYLNMMTNKSWNLTRNTHIIYNCKGKWQ